MMNDDAITPVPADAAAPVELVTFEIRTERFELFRKEFTKLVKRAVKLGVVVPTFSIIEHDKVIPAVVNVAGKVTRPARVVNVITVWGQAPKLNGWTFAAALQHESTGNLIRTVPGVTVQIRRDLRAAAPACEHCNLDRRRADTYVVAHDDGRQVQVGRTCLKDFTGHDSPEAIARWAEIMSAFADACDDSGWDDSVGSGGYISACTLDDFMPYVAANIRTAGWLSRTAARDRGAGGATADSAWMSRFPLPEQREYAIEPEAVDVARAAECMKVTRAYFEQHDVDTLSDYEHNLRIVVDGLSVTHRTAGIAASIINFAERLMGREIERRRFEARKVSATFIGEVGKRLDLVLTVEKIIDLEPSYESRFPSVTHLHVFTDADGNALKWFGSKRLDVGTTYNVRATVKKHEEWKGMKQTLLTRCACTRFDPNAPAPAPKAKRTRKAKTPATEA